MVSADTEMHLRTVLVQKEIKQARIPGAPAFSMKMRL